MIATTPDRDVSDLIPAHLKMEMARDRLIGKISVCGAVALFVVVLIFSNLSDSITLFRQMLPSSTFAASTGQGYLILAMFTVVAGGVGLALARYQLPIFFAVMVLATIGALYLSFIGLRQGWAISGSTIAIRPAQFWKPDDIFNSKNITHVRRTCWISHEKGCGLEYHPAFIATCSTGRHIGEWDLTPTFTVRDATPAKVARFVDAITGLRLTPGIPSETIGSWAIAANPHSAMALRVETEQNQCINFFIPMLDATRAAEFRNIVGDE